jgi:hypothetical protein
VLKALSDLKARGLVAYVLWDMPIRVVGEDVVRRDTKPADEVDDADQVGPEVVNLEEASTVGARSDTGDAPAIAAEVVHEAFIVVDRRKNRLRGFAHIEDACRSQHEDLPRGHGVVRVADGMWMSRLMPAGWGQPKADDDQEDDDG